MICTSDIDLEELESQLYSQVFHSTADTEEPTNVKETNVMTEISKVTQYSVNNVPVPEQKKQRYWCEKANVQSSGNLPVNDVVVASKETNVPILNEYIPITETANTKQKTRKPKKKKVKQSKAKADINVVHNYYQNQNYSRFPNRQNYPNNRQNVHHIPPLMSCLPLYSQAPFQQFFSGPPQNFINPYYNTPVYTNFNDNYSPFNDNFMTVPRYHPKPILINRPKQPPPRKSPPKPRHAKSLPSASPVDSLLRPSPAESPAKLPVLAVTEAVPGAQVSIIEITDSDNDSVEILPELPNPIFEISSSNESQDSEIAEQKAVDMQGSPGLVADTAADEAESNEPDVEGDPSLSDVSCVALGTEENQCDALEPTNQTTSDKTNRISESERTELLITPDSNTNDFIDSDVNQLEGCSYHFDFNLIDSDLDVTEKELTKPSFANKSLLEVCESESNCSSTSTPTKAPVFNQVDFENTKEIFCESDLSYFSNFIVPVRKSNENASGLHQIGTKASKLQASKPTVDEDVRDTSDADSDPTILHKKKSKKKKKKKCKADKESGQNEPEVEEPVEEVTEKTKKQKKKKTVLSDEVPTKKKSTKEKDIKKKSKKSTANTSKEGDVEVNSDNCENVSKTTRDKKRRAIDDKNREECENAQKEAVHKKKLKTSSSVDNSTLSKKSENENKLSTTLLPAAPAKNSKSCPEISSKITGKELPKSSGPNVKFKRSKIISIDLSNNNDAPASPSQPLNIVLANVRKSQQTGRNISAIFWTDTAGSSKINHDSDMKTFKDFWTHDKDKFYGNSWGQENYDLQRVLSAMPDDKSKWKIIPEDIIAASRYQRGPFCLLCKERGHFKNICPMRNQIIKCSICGSSGHSNSRCPNVVCTSCGNKNGYHTTSCNKCAYFRKMRCGICNFLGHPEKVCPDLWRRYHISSITDKDYNKYTGQCKTPDKMWCSACASNGHLYHECSFINLEHFPTNPYVVDSLSAQCTNERENITETSSNTNQKIKNMKSSEIRKLNETLTDASHIKYLLFVKKLKTKCSGNLQYFLPRIKEMENILKKRKFNQQEVIKFFQLNKKVKKAVRLAKKQKSL